MPKVNVRIARQVVDNLGVSLTPEEGRRLARRVTDNLKALSLYMQGREQFKSLTRTDVNRAIDSYKQALKEEPDFILPYLGLANAYYWLSGIYMRPKDAMAKAKDALAEALKRDDRLGEAHALLGFIMAVHDWDWWGAEGSFRRALQVSPESVSVRTYYGLYLAMLGRFPEALAQVKNSQDSDPSIPEIAGYTALILYFAGRYDEAIQALQAVPEGDRDNINLIAFLGLNYEQKGDFPKAIATFEKARKKDSTNPETFAQLGHAYALAGKPDEARKMLEELRRLKKDKYVSPYNFALIHVGLGETDRAIESLQQAAEDHTDWFACLKVDPRLTRLRTDPRFTELLHRAKLPP